MRALYMPTAVGAVGDEAAKAFRRAAATLPQPVLAYCASGRRVAAVAEKAGLSQRGKIILAEFGYGGKRMPSFPKWLIDDLQPSRIAWYLKEQGLPRIYWHGMLKGRELMAKPRFAAPVV
jgi:sulfide:quinone oxidoreductase